SAGPTVPARELEDAGCILLLGSNTVEAHPVLSFWVKRAVRHGGKIILVDPRETDIARLAYLHLRPRPGTDLALVAGMLRVLLDENLVNRDFVDTRTDGYDDLAASIAKTDLADVEKTTGVSQDDIKAAARLFATGGKDERYP